MAISWIWQRRSSVSVKRWMLWREFMCLKNYNFLFARNITLTSSFFLSSPLLRKDEHSMRVLHLYILPFFPSILSPPSSLTQELTRIFQIRLLWGLESVCLPFSLFLLSIILLQGIHSRWSCYTDNKAYDKLKSEETLQSVEHSIQFPYSMIPFFECKKIIGMWVKA